MSIIKQLEHKRPLTSTHVVSAPSLLQSSRPFASLPTPASEQAAPLSASPSSAQPSLEATSANEHINSGHTPSLGYSFATIPIFPRIQPQEVTSPLVEENQIGARIQSARSGGHPLDEHTQQRLEQGLGTDLSSVRMHTDAEADSLSRSVHADAFTTGKDIFFRSGMYHPSSSHGLHLLAHEMTHVMQQAKGAVAGTPVTGNIRISDPHDQFEQAAEVNAAKITTNSPESTTWDRRSSFLQAYAPANDSTLSFRQRGNDFARRSRQQIIAHSLLYEGQQRAEQASIQRAVTSHKVEPAEIMYQHLEDTDPPKKALSVERPKQVVGIIEKSNRGPTPDPLVFTSLSKAYKAYKAGKNFTPKRSVDDEIMFAGTFDRGHMMAAELGGADEEWNIVPQWSLNQQSGPWRAMEKEAGKRKKSTVEVTAEYEAVSGRWQKVGVPKDVKYVIKQGNKTLSDKSWSNEPDENDLLRASEEEMKLAIKKAIHDYISQKTKADATEIINHVSDAAKDEINNYINYRNKEGRAKKEKKQANASEVTRKVCQSMKDLFLQNEIKGSKQVDRKTKAEAIKTITDIKLSGVSSMFDEQESGSDTSYEDESE